MEGSEKEKDSKRTQFGNRYLQDTSKVFEHNAWDDKNASSDEWDDDPTAVICSTREVGDVVGIFSWFFNTRDDVEWDEDQEMQAREKIKDNSSVLIADHEQEQLDKDASVYWNTFYEQHENRFFKDRHWLFTEFSELADVFTEGRDNEQVAPLKDFQPLDNVSMTRTAETPSLWPGQGAHTRIFEVGCGVGNTVFPILQTNRDDGVYVYCCDFAQSAVDLVKGHPDFNPARCHPFVCDVANEEATFPFPEQSLDFIIMIFVLSAIHPNRMKFVFDRLVKFLKPGGMMLFRDYGRYDMAQLRFKKGKCLGDNFYLRGDGTRVYFFTQDEMRKLAEENGLIEEQNYVDRRLQVNRGKKLKMYRVWIQCKFRKPN